jgi:hypothetical protein
VFFEGDGVFVGFDCAPHEPQLAISMAKKIFKYIDNRRDSLRFELRSFIPTSLF